MYAYIYKGCVYMYLWTTSCHYMDICDHGACTACMMCILVVLLACMGYLEVRRKVAPSLQNHIYRANGFWSRSCSSPYLLLLITKRLFYVRDIDDLTIGCFFFLRWGSDHQRRLFFRRSFVSILPCISNMLYLCSMWIAREFATDRSPRIYNIVCSLI